MFPSNYPCCQCLSPVISVRFDLDHLSSTVTLQMRSARFLLLQTTSVCVSTPSCTLSRTARQQPAFSTTFGVFARRKMVSWVGYPYLIRFGKRLKIYRNKFLNVQNFVTIENLKNFPKIWISLKQKRIFFFLNFHVFHFFFKFLLFSKFIFLMWE